MFSYLTRTRGNTVWSSHDCRYAVIPSYRPPKRGGGEEVRDGWLLRDTWTEVERWYATLDDVDRAIHSVRMDRDYVRDRKDAWVGWAAATQTPSGMAELRVSERGGSNSYLLGLVSTKDSRTRWGGIENLLADVGLKGLPEVIR